MVEKRRRFPVIAVAIVIVATVALVARLSETGRLPFVGRAWAPMASAVGSAVASALPAVPWLPSASSAPADASGPVPDAGVKFVQQAAPLSSAQLSAPLVHGAFVGACGAPDDMKVALDLAVRKGRAVEVKVKTTPPNPAVATCIERAARDLRWDVSPHTGRVTVTY